MAARLTFLLIFCSKLKIFCLLIYTPPHQRPVAAFVSELFKPKPRLCRINLHFPLIIIIIIILKKGAGSLEPTPDTRLHVTGEIFQIHPHSRVLFVR